MFMWTASEEEGGQIQDNYVWLEKWLGAVRGEDSDSSSSSRRNYLQANVSSE